MNIIGMGQSKNFKSIRPANAPKRLPRHCIVVHQTVRRVSLLLGSNGFLHRRKWQISRDRLSYCVKGILWLIWLKFGATASMRIKGASGYLTTIENYTVLYQTDKSSMHRLHLSCSSSYFNQEITNRLLKLV